MYIFLLTDVETFNPVGENYARGEPLSVYVHDSKKSDWRPSHSRAWMQLLKNNLLHQFLSRSSTSMLNLNASWELLEEILPIQEKSQ